MLRKILNNKWFTIIELVIAISILTWILTVTSISIFQFTEDKRVLLLQNEIISETNYLFETIIRYVRNWNIDHQSYWRENIRNHSVDWWLNEWPNPKWVDSFYKVTEGTTTYNSIKNCSWAQTLESGLLSSDWDMSWSIILENYLYQFIFPWNPEINHWDGNFSYNKETITDNWKVVHLNCPNDLASDNIGTTSENERNIYDDDTAYWRWPRAFSWPKTSEWLWSWNQDSSLPKTANNPPLLLLSSDWKLRTAIRFWTWSDLCKNSNWSWCILVFQSKITENDWYSKEWIADRWECLPDYCWIQGLSWILSTDIWWQDITPSNIIVTNFSFNLWPSKDPELAFNEQLYVVPSYVTMHIWVKATNEVMKWISNKKNIGLNLQTTIIPRSLYSVKTLN